MTIEMAVEQYNEALANLIRAAAREVMDQADSYYATLMPLRQEPAVTVRSAALWLGADEVAEMLGLTARQVRELAKAGKLAGSKVGKSWRFRPDDVADYVRNPR